MSKLQELRILLERVKNGERNQEDTPYSLVLKALDILDESIKAEEQAPSSEFQRGYRIGRSEGKEFDSVESQDVSEVMDALDAIKSRAAILGPSAQGESATRGGEGE